MSTRLQQLTRTTRRGWHMKTRLMVLFAAVGLLSLGGPPPAAQGRSGRTFAALLPEARARLVAAMDAQERGDNGAPGGTVARCRNTMGALARALEPANTADAVRLIERAGERGGRLVYPLFSALAERGDGRAAPLFTSRLEGERPAPNAVDARSMSRGEALGFIMRSGDPVTVRFLTRQLGDPKADPQVRQIAFCTVARTGGKAGVRAVLAARDTSRTIPTVAEFMGLSVVGTTPASPGRNGPVEPGARAWLRDTRRDESGALWGLLGSGIMGVDYDDWLARYDGRHWVQPVFLGGLSHPRNWFERCVGKPAYTRDTDGDGWTDLLEERLGTDPGKADTDGDRIPDSRDRNPLAAAQPSTDEEKALAAAFEGRFRFADDSAVVCTVEMPAGMRPIEFRGWPWVVVHLRPGPAPLRRLRGHGVAAITFSREGDPGSPHLRKGFLRPGATEAVLMINTSYASLAATGYRVRVRKFGSDWLVVECTMVWIA